jgi:hypothetical protein
VRARLLVACCLALSFPAAAASQSPAPGATPEQANLSPLEAPAVRIVRDDAARRVDVLVDGKPFTSYVWPTTLKKPVLYPIRSAAGTLVTRGYPLDPRASERVDHPHHVGLWFNYGDVNGIDFWNNTDATPEADRPKMGTIVHKGIVEAKGGRTGVLTTDMDWLMPDGSVVLTQRTTYTFSGTGTTRTIDLDITLTARETRVALTDNKEGTLGLRVTRELEEPTEKPELRTDASGKPAKAPTVDTAGVNGVYLTSEGVKGAAVWGTRAKWCLLSGTVGVGPVSVAIFDRPGNPGYPTYWHARGYGLFAANPLGQKALSNGKDTLNFAIEPKQSARFRYRILVTDGAQTAAHVEKAYDEWAK